ncbi:MAG: PspC domain-containing protein [Candidatus Dadabacteria bacterium]|nr:PspC domain-containing protein [Candidatus Dadabacteria bacterium]
MAEKVRKLYRSSNDKMLAGICGGLGEMFSVDSTMVRLVVAALALFTLGTAVVVYILGWIIIPERPQE